MLAVSWPANPTGRNRLDDHADLVAANDRRGGQRICQTKIGSQSGRANASVIPNFKSFNNKIQRKLKIIKEKKVGTRIIEFVRKIVC